MGNDGSQSDSQGLKNLRKEWSLFWGRFIEHEESESHQKRNENTPFQNKIAEAVGVARLDLDQLQDLSQSMYLHKKLLNVEIESIQKEIEGLALQLAEDTKTAYDTDKIRSRLKELFAIEESLNLQMDSIQNRMEQTQQHERNMMKGVS